MSSSLVTSIDLSAYLDNIYTHEIYTYISSAYIVSSLDVGSSLWQSRATTSEWPLAADMIKGVIPRWKTYIHTYTLKLIKNIHTVPILSLRILIGFLSYTVTGLDVGSSLTKESHHLGVTLNSGCDQGGDPTLSDSKKRDLQHYQIRSGQTTDGQHTIAQLSWKKPGRVHSAGTVLYIFYILSTVCWENWEPRFITCIHTNEQYHNGFM